MIIDEDKTLWLNHRHEIGFEIGVHSEQFRIRNKDGRIVWIEHICRSVIDKENRPLGYRANNRDITKRKHAMESLINSEKRYRILIENTLESIVVVQEGKVKSFRARQWVIEHLRLSQVYSQSVQCFCRCN